jgi:hypothetical protein
MALKIANIEPACSLSALSVITTHTLFPRKGQCKLSNDVAAFAARGSPLDWQKSWQFAHHLNDADR